MDFYLYKSVFSELIFADIQAVVLNGDYNINEEQENTLWNQP